MQHNVAFYRGLHCLLLLIKNICSDSKNIEVPTSELLKYTMDDVFFSMGIILNPLHSGYR